MTRADAGTSSAISELFAMPAYALDGEQRRTLLLEALNESYRHHVIHCPAYARLCARRGFGPQTIFEQLEDFPFLPVQAFKEFGDMLCSTSTELIKTRLQSSATSGRPSTVLIDAVTARRQVQALTAVQSAAVGGKRRRFVICDIDPALENPAVMGARFAAVQGFLNLAREAHYVLRTRPDGTLEVMREALSAALAQLRSSGEAFAVFGFTYVLYESVMEPLLDGPPAPPSDAYLLHIGGWKKLEDRRISREAFAQAAQHAFGIAPERVVDFYGFTEQMGVVYPAIGGADRIAPVFADVIVRDPDTHKPLPAGQPGLLQFLTPLPHSYPGFSVLTDDVGMLIEGPGSIDEAFKGPRFRVLGRAKNAEVRGCGDIMADKMVARTGISTHAAIAQAEILHLLFFEQAYVDIDDPVKPIDLATLPKVDDMNALAEKLRAGRAVLDTYSYDELAALLHAGAKHWMATGGGLDVLRHQGLSFLESWCRPAHLAKLGDEALGARGFLDGFRPLGGAGRQVRAFPRGLVAHWLSGNVPLLGMLALSQSILTRNANILKSASTFSSALPALLAVFRGLEVKIASGRVLKGDDLLKSVAIVYYPKENLKAGAAMSMAADVRVAWGGRDAVEAIGQLPRRYDAEDVMFGPKLSYMAIGREHLADERALKKIARRAATDASVFDQYACASPHTIFVERGGAFTPREFAERLAREMAGAAVRIPKMPVDAATSARIAALRLRHEFAGEVFSSPGTAWTVIYEDEPGIALAEPCYSRVVTVRSTGDILAAADFATADIQTVGLGLTGERRQVFAERAARRGAYRFPDIGRMTEFDSVWDGLYMMDRFVKWISLGGPVL